MTIPLAEISVGAETRRAVDRVLSSGQFVKGEESARFEEEFAAYVGVKHAVAVSSGTAALHLAIGALGVKPGDEVLVPSFSFFATVSPLLHVGAKPVFVDIDPLTFTLSPEDARRRITRRTKGIVPVHLYGHPAEMAPLLELATERDLWVLEDACQAHGARYKDRAVGSMGALSAFSFYPSKNMTVCGDGGMVVTGDRDLAERVRVLSDAGRRSGEKYVHRFVGWNFRLSEIHSAIGRGQLRHLEEWVASRRRVARGYTDRLGKMTDLTLPTEMPWARHSFYVYSIRSRRRSELAQHLQAAGIATGVYYPTPIHRQPALKGPRRRLPETDRASREVLALPMFPRLSDDALDSIAREVRTFNEGT